ncbi:Uncharacterized protein HZ326_4408 [Fusarium oxysporum f. sp. albedinis]|nr:Uncharacterized protein HZ326_4408 [Fusarium oxysporum f. sp. albedinis]
MCPYSVSRGTIMVNGFAWASLNELVKVMTTRPANKPWPQRMANQFSPTLSMASFDLKLSGRRKKGRKG